MSDSYLQSLVINKCKELGTEKSAEFFLVGPGLIRQWVNGSKSPSLASVEKVFSIPDKAPEEGGWQGKQVFIGCPIYKNSNAATLTCLLGIWDRAKFGFRPRFGDAFIVHARNQLATDFLASNMAEFFGVDDDMVFPFGNAAFFNLLNDTTLPEKYAGLHSVNRLRSHGKSFVGALYFGRNAYGKAMYAEAMAETPAGRYENQRIHSGPTDELKETDWVGTGCYFHTRQVLLDIQEKFPHLAPQHPSEPFHFYSNTADALISSVSEVKVKAQAAVAEIQAGNAERASEVIGDLLRQVELAENQALKQNRLHAGEDVLFGTRAKIAGHQPHVDLGLVCGHVGYNTWNHTNTKVR
jgi:hypothetical protein